MLKKTNVVKKAIRIIRNVVCKVLLTLVVFGLLLVIFSADWFLEMFGEMDFSIVVYQLFSPMEGTSSEILGRYFNECFRPAVSIAVIVMMIYTFCDTVFRKCYLSVHIIILKKEIQLQINKRLWSICKWILSVAGLTVLTIICLNRAVKVGIPEYVAEITDFSTIFENEYVDPDETQITFPDKKRNLLLIYMESMESTYASIEAGGAKAVNYIPELTELAKQNLNFSDSDKLGGGHVYTEGWTMAGLLATSSGVPYKLPVEGNSAGEYEDFLPGLTCLGDILEQQGYRNYFMCGSDATFGGREAYYSRHGDYEILDYDSARESGVIPEDYKVYWGMEDEKLYSYAKKELTRIAGDGDPFNFTMLTVDTHHPDGYACELCQNQYPDQYANAIACASKQVYDFIKWVEMQDWYDNTTIVIVGDHTSMNATFWDDIGDYERNIYNCFINYSNMVSAANSTYREFSSADMFPTILAALGVQIDGNRLGLGVNLFSDEPTLPEKLGKEVYLAELRKYSNYYFSKFVVG